MTHPDSSSGSASSSSSSSTDVSRGSATVPRGLLVVLAGPSGVGKTSIARGLIEAEPETYGFSVSATTRPMRSGEVDGVDYFFVDRNRFESWIAEGRFVEHARYQDHYYGTLADQVEQEIQAGRVLLLDIDVQGMQQLLGDDRWPLLTIFVLPPSFEELAERLRGRGTEGPEVVAGRILRARQELTLAPLFDHQVVNNDLEAARQEVRSLIESARESHHRSTEGPPPQQPPHDS